MYIYAKINKDTLKFIREKKGISFDYILRIANFTQERIAIWEDTASNKFPTINQAKVIAKCYRIPFAGLYMNSADINVHHLPSMRNLRTLPDSTVDDSSLNLAIVDILNARDLLIESKNALKEHIPQFTLSIDASYDVSIWAKTIRDLLGISSDIQYKIPTARQFYLFVRKKVEETRVFVHCFTGIDTKVVRGFAIYKDKLPIIGLNNEDRYPAKTFSIIHELVHLIKRSSAICNEMYNSFSSQMEEIFCNAVAGEVLVPKTNLIKQLGSYTVDEIDYNLVDSLATKFSVSKEVVCRRLFDIGRISQQQFNALNNTIRINFETEREKAKEYRRLTGASIPRNMSREAIDKNSFSLCKTFYHGYQEGYFDKQDVSRYLGIKQKHIDKFMSEVSRW